MANLIGQTILGRYRVEAFIASGGMGTVFRVWDLKRNVPLAMKVLHTELADDPSYFHRFQREANALRKLTHPNIVPFYGLQQAEDLAFLLEAYIDGPTIREVLRKAGGPLPLDQALVYLKALSAALGYAHASGVVHCDVKPGNVMIAPGGTIFLTDFGVARHAESTTTTIGAAGTPAYMAPEQIRGLEVTPATDVYALGVMLFELLTGQRPFRGTENGTESAGPTAGERIRHAHLHLPAPDPRSTNPSILAGLAEVVLRAMEKDPARRFQDAPQFFAAICAAVGIGPEQVPDRIYWSGIPGQPPPPSLHPSRKPLGLWLVGIGALVVVALIGGAALGNRRSPPPVASEVGDQSYASPTTVPFTGEPGTPATSLLYTQAAQTIAAELSEVALATSQANRAVTEAAATMIAKLTQNAPVLPGTPTRQPPPPEHRPTRTPNRVSCQGAIRSQIQVDMLAKVCTQLDRVITRSEPAPESPEVFRIRPGTTFKVIGGPVCVDFSNWWQIRVKAGTTVRYGSDFALTEDAIVWVREGSDAVDPYYICP